MQDCCAGDRGTMQLLWSSDARAPAHRKAHSCLLIACFPRSDNPRILTACRVCVHCLHSNPEASQRQGQPHTDLQSRFI